MAVRNLSSNLKKIEELAMPLAQHMGLELLLIEETGEGGRRTLRIFLEHPDLTKEVNIGECASFSRAFSTLLDVEVEMAGSYNLEVSSPGLNRPLVKLKHFQAQIGSIIKVQTKDPVAERRNFRGRLLKLEGEAGCSKVFLQMDGETYEISLNQIKKASLDYFSTEKQKDNKTR